MPWEEYSEISSNSRFDFSHHTQWRCLGFMWVLSCLSLFFLVYHSLSLVHFRLLLGGWTYPSVVFHIMFLVHHVYLLVLAKSQEFFILWGSFLTLQDFLSSSSVPFASSTPCSPIAQKSRLLHPSTFCMAVYPSRAWNVQIFFSKKCITSSFLIFMIVI